MQARPTSGVYGGPLDRLTASRLMRRGWGWVSPEKRDALVGLSLVDAFARLEEGSQPGPRWDEIQRLESQSSAGGQTGLYRAWFLARLVESPQPLREMVAIFWLDVFAISALRIEPLRLFHDFCVGLRERAFSPLEDILRFALVHPAFLLNLRAAKNYRAEPQRQIGRFILQSLMSTDPKVEEPLVREIARAYTGLFVSGGELRRYDYEHDPGTKTIGKRTGDLKAEDTATELAHHPEVAQTLVKRLFRWFVASEEPVPQGLAQTAAAAFLAGQPTSEVLKLILGWEECLIDERFRRVKTPLEMYLAIARPLGLRPTIRVAETLGELGWDVIHPPTLVGWPIGRAWLTEAQLARRLSLVRALLSGEQTWGGETDIPARFASPDWPAVLQEVLLDGGLPTEAAAEWERLTADRSAETTALREAILFLTALPEFQLT